MIVIDGNDLIFGRMATHAAKKLLSGEEVRIINAEKLVLVGNPKQIVERYKIKRRIKHKGTPERSPKWSKVPHLLVKRMIRGMLPRKSLRGREALKRLKAYTGNPMSLEQNFKPDKVSFDGISKHITIDQLCKNIGYSG